MTVDFSEYWGGLSVHADCGMLLGHIKIAQKRSRTKYNGLFAWYSLGRTTGSDELRAIADKLDELNGVQQ